MGASFPPPADEAEISALAADAISSAEAAAAASTAAAASASAAAASAASVQSEAETIASSAAATATATAVASASSATTAATAASTSAAAAAASADSVSTQAQTIATTAANAAVATATAAASTSASSASTSATAAAASASAAAAEVGAATGLAATSYVFANLSSLQSVTNAPDGTAGQVTADATPANIGLYRSQGGVWTLVTNSTIPSLAAGIATTNYNAATAAITTYSLKLSLVYRDAYSAPGFVDLNGAMPLSFDKQGVASLAGLNLLGGELYRDSDGYAFSLTGNGGKIPFYIDYAGQVFFDSLFTNASAPLYRDAYPFTWDIHDLNGQSAFSISPDGSVTLRPSAATLEYIGANISSSGSGSGSSAAYLPPNTLLGNFTPFNVRQTSSMTFATINAGGRTYDVRQRRDISSLAAIVDSSSPIEGIFFYGQSNAGGGGGTESDQLAVLTSPKYPSHVFTFSHYPEAYGTGAVTGSDWFDFAALADIAGGPGYPAVSTGFALEARARRNDLATSGKFLFTDWYGGQPLSTFVRGTTTWNNLMTHAQSLASTAAAFQRSVLVKALVFIQGENGPSGRSTYGPQLESFLTDVQSALASAAGQVPLPYIFVPQINMGETDTSPSGVELGQWDACVALAGSRVVMPGPMYQFPFGSTENVHTSALGRLALGDLLALVYDLVVRQGFAFNPLWPVSVSRTGAVVKIEFALPPGGGPLAWETTDVARETNYGFTVVDSAATIQSVNITGASEVTITLTQAPLSSTPQILYAQGQPVASLRAAGRGNLTSPTSIPSEFAAMGYAVPALIKHFCIRFAENI